MTGSPFPDLAFAGPKFSDLLAFLESATGDLENFPDAWPEKQFERLAETGVLGWVIPEEFGGSAEDSVNLLAGYERLAAACLTTAFVLTQRNGACQRLAGSRNESLKHDLLPDLCAGRRFATVGISHLTTSRQHLAQPAVRVQFTDEGMIFDGLIPWVTGAAFAQDIVTGGVCADGTQVLAALDTAAEGVDIQPPPRLLALNAAQTGSVVLRKVLVPHERSIAGPAEQIMKQGAGGGTGSLTTSALALGAARAALTRLEGEAQKRSDLREVADSFQKERDRLAEDFFELAHAGAAATMLAHSVESIRQRANSLALRLSQAYLAACKGAGFVSGHPAERGVREAMFFLVWSCPQPVLTATLRDFACLLE